MKIISCLLLSFLFFSACAKTEEPLHILLLSGQSNMAGSGNYDALTSEEKAAVAQFSDRISISRNGHQPTALNYYVAPKKSEKYGFEKFFGPELFIALKLAEVHPEQDYLFIKYSVGGTSLYGAWNPEWTAEKAQEVEKAGERQEQQLYAEHLAAITNILDSLDRAGRAYKIIGEVWMQGENDAAKEPSALSYGENLTHLIAHYRKDVEVPALPFIFGQINSTYGRYKPGPAAVRSAMAQVAERDPLCTMIPTSTDASWSDYPKHEGVHYNTEGQRRLGRAMAGALMDLSTKN